MFNQIFEQIMGIFCRKFQGKIEVIFRTDFRKNFKQNHNQIYAVWRIFNYGECFIVTKFRKKFEQIKKMYFGNVDEILNQIVVMFYANFVANLNIKNTSWKTHGKDSGKF